MRWQTRLSQRCALWLVVLHGALTWSAMALRVDQFPLTWAPMYSTHVDTGEAEHRKVFKDKRHVEERGWQGIRRDGATEWIRRRDVNVPMRSMWRLYYQRSWGQPPAKEKQKNSGDWSLDRWVRGLPPGAPIYSADWERRLLVSVNKTLQRAPEDADFIVRLVAMRTVMRFDGESLAPLGRSQETAEIAWRRAWSEDFRE